MKLSKALARILQRQVLTEIETLRRSTESQVSATTSQVFAARSTLSSQIQELSNDLVLIRHAITALGQQVGAASRAFDVQTHRLHDDMVQLAIKQQVADEMHVQINAALTILQEKQIELHQFVRQETAMLSDQAHANHQTALVEIERIGENAPDGADHDWSWALDLLLGLYGSGSLNMADAAHVAETLNDHGIETGARAPIRGKRRVSDAGDFDDTTRQPVPNARVGWGSLGDVEPRVADEEGV